MTFSRRPNQRIHQADGSSVSADRKHYIGSISEQFARNFIEFSRDRGRIDAALGEFLAKTMNRARTSTARVSIHNSGDLHDRSD
jgi:hypothetical protein